MTIETLVEARQIILIMTSVHPWNDPRIFYKEALSLSKRYQVEVHAPADFKLREENEVKVFGLPRYQKRYLRFLNWIRLLFRALISPARYIHFHDPELIPVAIVLKLLTSKKVIYDVHENLPASIMTKPWIPKFMRKSLAWILDIGERKASRFFDGIILAEFSYLERFHSLPTLIQSVVNYPPKAMGEKMERQREFSGEFSCISADRKNDPVRFVYAGVISKTRGIEEIIKSFGIVHHEGLDFHLFLAGSWFSADLRREMEELMRNLDISEHITITGKIPFHEMRNLYQQADVGLALLHPEENYVTSFATKIFEYMATGIPVLASDFPLWKVLVLGHQCGLTANPLDPVEISRKISLLINEQCLRCRLGRNGWQKFNSHYHWETQEQIIWDFYQKISGG